jgi:hypothetical protein
VEGQWKGKPPSFRAPKKDGWRTHSLLDFFCSGKAGGMKNDPPFFKPWTGPSLKISARLRHHPKDQKGLFNFLKLAIACFFQKVYFSVYIETLRE